MASQSSCNLYEALPTSGNSVRRLQLYPGRQENPISCGLDVVSLQDKPCYEALSYCWGDAGDKREVTCNGKRVSITVNLWSALRDLRLQDEERTLWVDALCINQADDTEKTVQVQMMEKIYRQANKVIVHLGSVMDTETETALGLAINLMWGIARTEYSSWAYVDPNGVWQHRPQSDEDLAEKGLPSSDDPSWQGLGLLLGRPWFSRAWVRQEMILARDVEVRFGEFTFPWCMDSVLDAALRRIHWMDNDAKILGTFSRLAYQLSWTKAHFLRGEQRTLLDVVWSDFTSKASDPRDHLFAYVSLASHESPAFEIDYSLSPAQVFARFTLHCISLYGNLSALDAVKDSNFSWSSLFPKLVYPKPLDIVTPSWVNDWSRQLGDRTQILKKFQEQFRTSGDLPARIEAMSDKLISLRGFRLDIIDRIEQFLKDEDWVGLDPAPKRYLMLPSWERLISEASLKYDEPRSMVFFRTLVSRPNLRESAPGGDPWAFFRCWYSRFGRGILQDRVDEPDGMGKDEIDKNAAVAQAMVHEYSWMTRLFTTKKGYIGTTQRFATKVQSGDLVCLLYGGRCPYLLRPRLDGTYCFLGACYIEALIQGEGLQWSKITEECFTLT